MNLNIDSKFYRKTAELYTNKFKINTEWVIFCLYKTPSDIVRVAPDVTQSSLWLYINAVKIWIKIALNLYKCNSKFNW